MADRVGERIREARRSAKLTQDQLAQKLGISTVTLNRYEKGHRSPDAAFLNQMVVQMGCDSRWLLTGQCSKSSDDSKTLPKQIESFGQTEQPKYDPSLKRIIEILEKDLPEDVEHILKILLARIQLKEGFSALASYPQNLHST